MKKLELYVMTMGSMAKQKVKDFLYDEKGDVNIVSIVVLIGVAVVLALLFRKQIQALLERLFKNIGETADEATKKAE
ncbi:MAG: flagellin-like protein [Lachnospiraceae bacterium]|nr:flagellin-like protein [Lachnospiraceae bacterium]